MPFGTLKSGTNSTDKKAVRAWHKAGWSIDKIAAKLSLKPEMVEAVLENNKAPVKKVNAGANSAIDPVDPVETFEQMVTRMFNEGNVDAADIAVAIDADIEQVEAVIAGLED